MSAARVAYEAWVKTHTELSAGVEATPSMRWESLPERSQLAWVAAAHAVIKFAAGMNADSSSPGPLR